MRIFQLFVFFFLLMLISCQNKRKNAESSSEHIDSILILRPDCFESSDTIKLSHIADTVFYVSLPYTKDIIQIQYLDSLIFVQTKDSIFTLNQSSELLYKTPTNPGSCFDLRPEKSKFYVYDPFKTKEIKIYDFRGNELKCVRLKIDEEGFYGASFLAANDSLFILSMLNAGFNENELIFVNSKGRKVGYKKNVEPFVETINASTHNEIWPRTLFRTSEGLRYHRCYRDTLFAIEQDMTLNPVLIEQKIAKVPINKRIECVGGNRKDYLSYCYKNKKYAVRMYENSRYYIAEYILGKLYNTFPNYLIYDKKTGKLNRAEIDFDRGVETHQFHFGIFNDYDGGLAFTPMYQTRDYLIMVNAGEAQGGGRNTPKALYKNGRKIINELYPCRSNIYRSVNDKKRVDTFFENFDDMKNTMLMIVRLKNNM